MASWTWPWTPPKPDPTLASLDKKLDALTALVTAQHKEELKAMNALDQAIADAEQSASDMEVRVLDDLKALAAQIVELQGQIDAGGATPDRLARLAALKAKMDGLDPHNPATLPV